MDKAGQTSVATIKTHTYTRTHTHTHIENEMKKLCEKQAKDHSLGLAIALC